MGDICDLPNFGKKPWIRRVGLVRLLLAVTGALMAAIAWGDVPTFPNDVEMTLQIHSPRVLIGQPVAYSIQIKNNGDLTVKLTDLQVAIQMAEAGCAEHSQSKRSFSLPQNLTVVPNDTQSISGTMEIVTPCDGKAVSEIFAVLQRDTQRISVKRPGPSLEIL